jgi:RNA polymerase sigma-70 factor (ECF subfamily)
MKSAIVHNVSRCVSPACPQRRSKMTTTSYDPNEAYVPPARVSRKEGLTSAGSKAGNSLGSQLSSQSSLHDGNYACGHSEVSDDDLITSAQRGDQKAFVELCGRHSTVTKKMIFRIVRNHEDAEDALQDTLLRAYTHLTSFRRSCKFSTWLTTIGVNSALMILRKRRVRREIYASTSSLDTGTVELQEPVDPSPGPEGIYLKQQAILLVRREVEKLQPSLRSAVNHYYGSECSLEEAAKAHEISLGAAKSRLLRGRAKLRSSLARYGISKSRN